MSHRASLMALLLCVAPLVQALSSDREQPIHIQADYVQIDKKAGVSEYRGNVHLVQGSMEITGELVRVRQTDGALSSIVVKGEPATFQQQPDNQAELVRSQAREMEYQAHEERIVLSIDAEVKQGNQHFAGNRIVYNTRNSSVVAQGDEQQQQRVRAVIVPKKDETTPP
ncbi:MAG: lipopolysaccharide transport periplasmic protein LptA [Gammaproteobacteria bacterium]